MRFPWSSREMAFGVRSPPTPFNVVIMYEDFDSAFTVEQFKTRG
jgi:hypothetical protein